MQDFFDQYLEYTGGGETPAFFRRWSAIGMIGAWMGRQVYCKFGNSHFHTNMYIMLLGNAGTKKSTAIKGAKKLLRHAGYENFSATKVSKEKFLLDLGTDNGSSLVEKEDFLEAELFGVADTDDIRETWICADEFNEFFANNIPEFCSTLGDLWDWEGPPYENRIKNGQSVIIPNPTVSILGGNTPTAFAQAFPPEAVGQGFFSRVIVVHAKPTGIKVTWPTEASEKSTKALVDRLLEMRNYHFGEVDYTPGAKKLVDKIYKGWKPLGDVRFEAYSNRRLTHLLKLSLVHSVASLKKVIDEESVLRANTTLHHAEIFMPEAFGQYGASKASAQMHKVMQVLEQEPGTTTPELWGHVQTDFDRLDSFITCLSGMTHAGKIRTVEDRLFPVFKPVEQIHNDMVDYNWLSPEERER